jgi:hypothetical protein
MMQNTRERQCQQKVGDKEDKAQPEILSPEENPIPGRVCDQQQGGESQCD